MTTSTARRSPKIPRWAGVTATYLGSFFVLLLASMPKGFDTLTTAYQMSVLSTSETARKVFGGSDAGSLLGAALSVHENHRLLGDTFGVYSFWPPGMVAVDTLLLEIEGATGIPLVLLMVLANCAAWAALIGTVFLVVRARAGILPALLLVGFISVYSGLAAWGITSGLFFSDSFGAIGYCFSLLFLFMLVGAETRRRRLILAAAAGVAFAAACYFRASYELVSQIALIASLGLLVIGLVVRRVQRTGVFGSRAIAISVPLVVMGIVSQIVLLPWRLYAGLKIHPGDFRWSTVSDLTSAARWVPDKVLLESNGGFLIAGHSNWACISDAVECKRIYDLEMTTSAPYSGGPDGYFTKAEFDHLTVQSVLSDPLRYLGERLNALTFGFATNTGAGVGTFAVVESIVIIAILVATIVVLARKRSLLSPAPLFFLVATALQLATLALIHMEARYFLGVELGIIIVGGLVLGDWWRQRRSSTTTPEVVTDVVT